MFKAISPSLFSAAVVAAVLGMPAHASVLTFEDLSGPSLRVPDGYGGLHWSDFGTTSADPAGSGYAAVAVDGGSRAAFNWQGLDSSVSADQPFALNSAYFAGAWNNGLEVTVTGYHSTGGPDIKTFTVDTSKATKVVFDWTGLTSVTFSSKGGTPNPLLTGFGTHFALDSLDVTTASNPTPAVPESGSGAMLALGLAGLSAIAIRKRGYGDR